ncbi:MAG TPA: hypothetical protein VI341_09995 [Actinomycetota bacterium]
MRDEGERVRALTHRLEGVERRLARLSAALDGAAVTLIQDAERLRPPAGPDPALQLQRIAGFRDRGPVDGDR